MAQIGIEALATLLDPFRARRPELPAGCGSPPSDAHLLEGVAEDVVEQIGRTLERRQLLEEHEEGQRQRVGVLDTRGIVAPDRLG